MSNAITLIVKIKVKVTRNITMQPDGGIAPTHLQPGTRRRYVVSNTLRSLYLRKRPSTHYAGG